MKICRVFCLAILLGVLLLSLKSEAVAPIEVLTVVGQFEGFDETESPIRIVLIVNGEEAMGPLSDRCTFIDEKGNYIERIAFLQSYFKRIVTISLIEETGEVVECRVGS